MSYDYCNCSEYFVANDSKHQNDENRKQRGASSSHSNADLITNHLNETTVTSKTSNGTPQYVNKIRIIKVLF